MYWVVPSGKKEWQKRMAEQLDSTFKRRLEILETRIELRSSAAMIWFHHFMNFQVCSNILKRGTTCDRGVVAVVKQKCATRVRSFRVGRCRYRDYFMHVFRHHQPASRVSVSITCINKSLALYPLECASITALRNSSRRRVRTH